jgi:hypothetical protein
MRKPHPGFLVQTPNCSQEMDGIMSPQIQKTKPWRRPQYLLGYLEEHVVASTQCTGRERPFRLHVPVSTGRIYRAPG